MKQLLLSLLACIAVTSTAQTSYWTAPSFRESASDLSLATLDKELYSIMDLDQVELQLELDRAPLRGTGEFSKSRIQLLTVSGSLETFAMFRAPVLDEATAAQFPQINSYVGNSMDRPGVRVRLTATQLGVRGMLTDLDGHTEFIQPIEKGSTTYMAYRRGVSDATSGFSCSTETESTDVLLPKSREDLLNMQKFADDQRLRSFRIAVSTNAEYTAYQNDGNNANGNAQADALAAVVATLARNNEVFENDMGITYTLVSGTNLIYTNPNTDPYAASNTSGYNSALQSVMNAFGAANYDIGHAFMYGPTNNGNAGCIGCVCEAQKGSGWSRHTFTGNAGEPYLDDFFDIDYVPHEIGHQMGGNHTFSHNTEGAGVNVEPGSGSTIMGYAGITGINNVVNHSHANFNAISIFQINFNIDSNPNTCWTQTTFTNNDTPTVVADNNLSIPAGTAYVLEATGSDPDGDIITYTWEQYNSAQVGSANFGPTRTTGATIRSLPATTDPDRYVPNMSRILAGNLTQTNPLMNDAWETVSTVGRTNRYLVTVRDRDPGATGQVAQTTYDLINMTVVDTGAPFAVTAPAASASFDAGSDMTVTWDVAGTTGNGINVATVRILLSTDGGATWPTTLEAAATNDGSQVVTLPGNIAPTSDARIMVRANGNRFLAVNPGNFSIQDNASFTATVQDDTASGCSGTTLQYSFDYVTNGSFSDTVDFSLLDTLPANVFAQFTPAQATASTTVLLEITSLADAFVDNQSLTVMAASSTITELIPINLTLQPSALNDTTLLSPLDGESDLGTSVTLTWDAVPGAIDYDVELDDQPGFNAPNALTVNGTSITMFTDPNKLYQWRVRANGTCGTSAYVTRSFSTGDFACTGFDFTSNGGNPMVIDALGTPTVDVEWNITDSFDALDVSLTLNIQHSWVGDLKMKLISPQGTEVQIMDQQCGLGDNINATFTDVGLPFVCNNGVPAVFGTLQAQDAFAAFNGEDVQGIWTLRIEDVSNYDGGSVIGATLNLCGSLVTLSSNDFDSAPSISVYPNPNDGNFTVGLIENGNDARIAVYSMTGQQVFASDVKGFQREAQVSMATVAAGVYMVQVQQGDQRMTQRIVVR